MTRTAERNGVLIYVAPRSQKFAVHGRRGIHERLRPRRSGGDRGRDGGGLPRGAASRTAIVKGVARAGEALGRHFPRREGAVDVNELPDDVTED